MKKTKKQFEFECSNCWDDKKNDSFKFKTNDWDLEEYKEYEHSITIILITSYCPKCNCSCCIEISLSEMLRMLFELQEEVKKLKRRKQK